MGLVHRNQFESLHANDQASVARVPEVLGIGHPIGIGVLNPGKRRKGGVGDHRGKNEADDDAGDYDEPEPRDPKPGRALVGRPPPSDTDLKEMVMLSLPMMFVVARSKIGWDRANPQDHEARPRTGFRVGGGIRQPSTPSAKTSKLKRIEVE